MATSDRQVVNGVVYMTQDSKAKSDIKYLDQAVKDDGNIINTAKQDGYYIARNGVKAAMEYTACHEYIPCKSGTQYYKTGDENSNGDVVFYDFEKTFIGYNNDHTFTTPEKCVYMSVWWWTNYGQTDVAIYEGNADKGTPELVNQFKFSSDDHTNNQVESRLVEAMRAETKINDFFIHTGNIINVPSEDGWITPAGQDAQADYTRRCKYIVCRANAPYYRTGQDGSIGGAAFYDASKKFISYSDQRTFTTPDNCFYMSVWWWTNYGDMSISVYEGSASRDLTHVKNEMRFAGQGDLVYHVIPDGSGDYTNPKDCFDAIFALNGAFRSCIVYLHEGEYEVKGMFTADEWNNAHEDVDGNHYWGLTVPNGVDFIGYGNVDNIRLVPGTTETSGVKSTLNLRGTASIRNMTIVSGNLRYAIHDDMAWYGYPYYRKVIGCKIIDTGAYYGNGYGAGCANGGDFVFDTTLFKSEDNSVPFSIHNASGQDVETNILFRGCSFDTENATDCQFPSLVSNAMTHVMMYGCRVKKIMFKESTPGSGAGTMFTLDGGGNTRGCVIENTGSADVMSFADDT